MPNLDIVAPRYDIWMGVRDTVQQVYTGIGSLGENANRDVVDCVIWRSNGSPRVSCNGRTREAVVSGGGWTDIASLSVVGGLLGWEIGIQTLGRRRWRVVTLP